MGIQNGSKVTLNYTLRVDGEIVDSSTGGEPLVFVHGSGQIIPGLEEELLEMNAGDKKSVTVKPENGYGEHDPKGIQKVPRSAFSGVEGIEVGSTVGIQTADGKQFPAKILELGDEEVTLDLNHPLAGKKLDFEVEIVDVEQEA